MPIFQPPGFVPGFSWVFDPETGYYITTQTDIGDEFNWDVIVTTYDPMFIPFPPVAYFAPFEEEYEVFPEITPPFEIFETVSISTTFDNGIVNTQSFSMGNLTSVLRIDGEDINENWLLKYKEYDNDGNVTLSARVTDDLVAFVSTFGYDDGDNQYLTSKVHSDLSEDGSAKDWETKIFEYEEETGELLKKTVVFDDGREKVVTHNEDGKVVNWTDGSPESYNWDTIEISFDNNGDRLGKTVVQDDGDVTFTQFFDDQKLFRLDFDISDTHEEWFARQIIYDCDGDRVDTIYFDTFEELQEEFVVPEPCEFLIPA